MRFLVEEARTRTILERDLEVKSHKLQVNLSGPATLEFELPYKGYSQLGWVPKAWGQIIHCIEDLSPNRQIISSCIIFSAEVDPESGNMKISAKGFSGYAEEIPWLENYNPVIVDPFEIVERIWNHMQSYAAGDMDVTVYPTSSGTFLLPGFYFDGTEFVLDFFAIFVRAVDFKDCADEINKLARDIPFDYIEKSVWHDSTHMQIDKTLELAYPRRGGQRTDLAFRFGDNVLSGVPSPEVAIEWTSDVIVNGWFPGKVYSSTFTNADPVRFRRVIREEDAKVNSNERAQVRAKRKLTMRQVPDYWSSITIDPMHSNAPFGTWELGDEIFVQGMMPWVGKVEAWHRITSFTLDASGSTCELGLKHEGAFNYDPLEFEGS